MLMTYMTMALLSLCMLFLVIDCCSILFGDRLDRNVLRRLETQQADPAPAPADAA